MLKFPLGVLGALIVLGGASAAAAPLQLRSDSNTIRTKSRAIEKEYSRDMRKSNAVEVPVVLAPLANQEEVPQQGAIVIEEGGGSGADPVEYIQELPGNENTYYSSSPSGNSFAYASNLKMRDDRKAGAGMTVGGVLGVVGFNMELNFEDADGVIAGFGTGPGYNSFQLAWKHTFEGEFIAPYTSVGYSRWYNSRGSSDDYSQSNILDRVLTENEKKEGRFGTDFVNASLGLQYNQLTGDFAGVSFFGEFTAMFEAKRSVLLPNGAIGAVYYF